jgi:hypothetical protein
MRTYTYVKDSPPDVVDDEDERHVWSRGPTSDDEAKGGDSADRRTSSARDQESHSRSRSSFSEDPTKHAQQHYRILLQKASC